MVDDNLKSQCAFDVGCGNDTSSLADFLPYIQREESVKSTLEIAINGYTEKIELAEQESRLLNLGKTCLSLFIQDEWTGPKLSPETLATVKTLECGCSPEEIYQYIHENPDEVVPLEHPTLLLLSLLVLEKCHELFGSSKVSERWYLRSLFIQQSVLDERSPKLYNKIEKSLEAQANWYTEPNDESVVFFLESARIRLYYEFVDKAAADLAKASEICKLSFHFTGMLGKRTYFQQTDLAQLIMSIDVDKKESVLDELPTGLIGPKKIALGDDVRLEEIKLADPAQLEQVTLTKLHIAILTGHLLIRKKSMPEDELSIEESLTLISRILKGEGSWPVQLSILLARSHFERRSRRTVERAMMQIQSILDEIQSESPPVEDRLVDFFISHLPMRREVESTLADFQIALGAIKSALDICLRLKNWELAIYCYSILQLRHKAKELIEEQLSKGETPKLLCLLGDATDDVTHYERAWIISKEKSSRAQRHWANFLYGRKKYGESIEHFEQSLAINSLQSDLWFRLGFAALHEERYELGAKAYLRYVTLEHDCFEAWNNLARCYCELKQVARAFRALKEALKVDSTNWRVWDNYMRVAADLKEYREVLRSYNEVLNLKKSNHVDLGVLSAILKGYFSAEASETRKTLMNSILDLLERIASQSSPHTTDLWIMMADVLSLDETPDGSCRRRDCLLKAHTFAVTQVNQQRTVEACQKVVDVLEQLLPYAEKDVEFRRLFFLIGKQSVSNISRTLPEAPDICTSIQQKMASLEQ